MNTFVARAMQVATMDKDSIKKIQEVENIRGYPIPNWNIQELISSRSAKEMLGIPFDEAAQQLHATRVERELTQTGYFKHATGEDFVDAIHRMDWMVFNNPKKINFSYTGGLNLQGSLRSKLRRGDDVHLDLA